MELSSVSELGLYYHEDSRQHPTADYLVNMLPHKIGKVIAHGVANPVL